MKRILTLAAFGLLAFQSCKKDDDNNSTPSLVGNWKMTSYAYDTNNDGVMQSTENNALDSGDYGYMMVTNSTLKDSISMDGFNISYTFPSYTRRNDSVFVPFMNQQELYFVIQKLDASNLNIFIPDNTGSEWRNYTRN